MRLVIKSVVALLLAGAGQVAAAAAPPARGAVAPPVFRYLPADFRSAPYQRVDPHARISGDLQRLYRRWLGTDGQHPTARQLRAAFPMLLLSRDGKQVLVRITLKDAAALATPLRARGFKLVSAKPRQHFVEGWLPLTELAPGDAGISRLAGQGLMGVLAVVRPATNGGLITNQADYVHEAARVRASVGHFDGTGVRVGVMSDSYDALAGAADGVASGDLPAAGVQVLQDYPGGSDEGRGMCELVHDVAPGAGLAFSSVFLGEGDFADQIRALANPAAGNCKVLVDDVSYLYAPMFQDGVIAQAVEQVVAGRNVTYFSSAGNEDNNSVEIDAPTFVPGAGGVALLDFDTGAGADTRQHFTLPPGSGANVQLALQWSDPFYTIAGVQTDLDLYLLDASGDTVASSANDNRLSQTPVEGFYYSPPSSQSGSDYDLLIVRRAGTATPTRVKYANFRGTRADEFLPGAGTIYGHHAATNAMCVAAAPFYARQLPEGYTSWGSPTFLFDSTGVPLTSSQVRPKPDFTAADGCANTFFNTQLNSTPAFYFFGTSAAAPNAAAVAALLQQAEPTLTPAQVYSRLQTTTTDLLTPGFDVQTGAGLINAYNAIFDPVAPAVGAQFYNLDAGLPRAWDLTASAGDARGQVRGDLAPASGTGALVLDAGHFGSTYTGGAPPSAVNYATLRLDLSGAAPAGGWALTFRHKKLAGESDNALPATFTGSRPGDGVVLSVDGGANWFRLVQLTGATGSTTSWQTATVDLTQFAQTNSLTLGADVRIRFQQNGPGLADGPAGAPAGGRAFDDVRVAAANAPAVALFTSSRPLVGCPGLSVQYQDASLGAAAGATYAWTFAGGTPATATGPAPTVTYNAPGHHAVTLTVTSSGTPATRQDTGYVFIYGRAPLPSFSSTGARLFCPGGQVQFSGRADYCPSGLSWSFPGGQPATSTSATPLVTYSTPGTYAVTLTSTNAFGTGTATETDYVVVTNGAPLPVAERFAGPGVPAEWRIENPDQSITWQKADSVVNHDGTVSGAMQFPFYPYAAKGTQDVLLSLPVNLAGLTAATLRFDIAYEPLPANLPGGPYDDSLAVDVQEFCTGAVLGRVYVDHAYGGLGTVPPAPAATSAFVPQDSSEWRTEAADLSAYVGQKVVVRFVAKNQYGNDLYLDNVTLNDQPLGLQPLVAADATAALQVWPNPARATARVRRADAGAAGAVTLLDGLGRAVRTLPLAAGQATATLALEGLPVGLYVVRVGAAARRLVVE